uniref:Uncharacterized protein n=1 Tax=Molossus molossus TaxID=27622 RepID=A0A7J8I8H9_MOLMO|nr:hypothetical protein HJG59_010500 [Molossus molossus]
MEEADREGGFSNLHPHLNRGTWEWGGCYAKGKSFRWERELGRTMELERGGPGETEEDPHHSLRAWRWNRQTHVAGPRIRTEPATCSNRPCSRPPQRSGLDQYPAAPLIVDLLPTEDQAEKARCTTCHGDILLLASPPPAPQACPLPSPTGSALFSHYGAAPSSAP